MNSTFKVVFNKARGALMVVNEVTSSVQAKGTKTVVAAAVATMIAGVAGSTMAAEWVEAPEDAATSAPADWKLDKNAYHFSTKNTEAPGAFLGASEKDKTFTFDKSLWVNGVGQDTRATGLWAANGSTIKNTGKIYVTGKTSWQNHAMGAANGAKAINAGTIVAKNAYGMFIGTSKNGNITPTIQNDGRIVVEGQGAGFELGGDGVQGIGINNGTITVGEVFDKNKGKDEWAHGVLINTATNTFENNGTINATAEGTSAIEVKDGATTTTLNFGEKSDVNGLIHLAAGTVNMTFNGTQDELTIKTEQQKNYGSKSTACKILAVNLTLDKGANITLEDGQAATIETVELENSRLNASIWGADNTFKSVTIKENGIFNVTKLNSKSEGATENDQLLLARGTTWNLNGGKLYVAGTEYTGTLRIGSGKDKGSGELNVSEGSALNLTRLEVQKSGTVNVKADGSITTETLHLSKGNVYVNGGSLTVTGDKGFTVFKGTENKAPTLTLTNGTFTVDAGSLFKEKAVTATAADAKKNYEATDAAKVITGTGTVNVTSKAFEYSLDELRKGQQLLNTEDSSAIKLVLANGTLKLGKDEELNANNVDGLNLAGHTGVSSDGTTGTFAVQQTTTIGAIDFNAVKDKAAKGITLDNAAALTLAGNGGDVFKNLGAKVTTVTTGDLVLGTAGNSGNVNVENLDANTLTVVGAFDAENVSFTADSSIKEGALLDVAKLTSEHKMAVAGTLVADVIDANVTVDESGVLVLGERQLAPTERALLAATPAAPEFVDQIQKVVTANNPGALVTTNKQGQALFAAAAGDRFDAEKNVGLYVDHTIGVDDTTGKLLVGNVQKEKATGTVGIADNSVVVIDTKKFGAEDTVFDATLSISKAAPVILSGLTTNTSFILATETDNATTPNIKLVDNTVFFDGKLTKAENGNLVLNTVFNDKVTDDAELNDVIKTQLDGSHNQKNADVLAAIADTTKKAGLVNKEGTALTDKGVQAVEEYLVAPLTAGALNLAYDATAQVNAVVENRVLEKADGVWADVFYASNKDSERYGDFGYSADITGGTLGVDTTVSCGAKIGAAFTIGQGDADSEGTVHGYSTDADFYGISLYAGRNVADTSLRISGNLSYLMFENDIKGSVAGASADESLDGKAFTAGLRADWTAYEGAFTVAPHAGLRYTFLEMDDYRDLEIGDMNVVEMPFGVKVSGAFEPAAGWTLQPSVDFTVVPQLGDKDVDTALGSVDVIDNLYNTELGVEAATGNFSFGLSYKYGFGKEDRKNQSLNLNARYMF